MNAQLLPRSLKSSKQNKSSAVARHWVMLFAGILLLFAGQVKAQTYSSNWFSAEVDPCVGGVNVDFVMLSNNTGLFGLDEYWQDDNNYIQIKIGSGAWTDWLKVGLGSADPAYSGKNYSIEGKNMFCFKTANVNGPISFSSTASLSGNVYKIQVSQKLSTSAQGQQINFRVKAGSYFADGPPNNSLTFDAFNGVLYNPDFAAPTSVTATPICNGVRLSWVNPAVLCGVGSNDTYYTNRIYINDEYQFIYFNSYDGNVTSVDIQTVFIGNTTFDFVPGQNYQFKMQTEYAANNNIIGESAFTSPVSASINTAPGVIQNLQATTDLCRKVELNWNQVSNCDSVKILIQYRDGYPFMKLTTLSSYITEYTVNSPTNSYNQYGSGTGLANEIDPIVGFNAYGGGFADIVYKFKVVGKNQCGWGAESPEVTGKPQKVPTQILRKKLTVEGNGVRLRWGSSPTDPGVGDSYFDGPLRYTVYFETGFRIIRASSSGQIVEFVAPADAVSFLDNTVVGCETYTYNVFPVNECAPNGYDCNYLNNPGPEIFAINYNPSVYAQYRTPISITTTPNISNVLTSNSFQASKGYYPNRVELSWAGNQLELIDLVRVFRKQLGSADAPVLIGSVAPSVGVFIDNFADAGTLYEYSIRAEKTCNASLIYSDILYTVGFRSPIATVNGSVTYSGGSAVEGVRISAESNSQINGAALELNGGNASIAHNDGLNPSNAALIEGWIKPNSLTSDFTWVSKPGQYEATYVSSSNQFSFKVFTPSTNYTLLSDAGLIQPNNYNHLAFQLRNDSLQIYVNGQLVNAQYTDAGITINPGVSSIIIGQGFNGSIDEVRIWNTSKSAKEIRQNYSRYLTGGEAGLKVYLKFDESNGNSAYDISRVNSNYNKNNATFLGGSWSTSIPTSAQLSNAAYTNNLGNYTLVLPYNGVGESFTLSPSYLNHTPFLPASRVIYLGDGSFVQNNIDFVDQSSFTVTGSIFYAGTNCPAKDINIRVDGQVVVVAGEPVKTNSDGSFSVEVPIGQHYVDAYKEGHVFTVGRFPSAAGTTYNFQSDMQVNFTDNTLIKVIGRAVGGDREGNKMPTLSKNNIGKTKVIFTSESGCAGDTLITDNITGEYVTYLPPLKYIISAEVISNPLIYFGEQDLLDLTVSLPLQTDIVSENVNVNYNYKKNFIYHNVPEISVTDIDGVSPFIGDDELVFIDPATGQTQYRSLVVKPLRFPIFSSGDKEKIYKCLIKVYEPYLNAENGKRDSVPSTNGRLYVSNQMADSYTIESGDNSQTGTTPSVLLSDVNDPETLKSLVYSFKATRANFNVDANIPEYSYTQRIDISVIQEDGTIIPPWSLRAYNLGVQSVGNQYFTTGPDVVEYVLRDPPGNASFATREAGTTKTRSTTWGWNAGSSAYANDLILVGTKFTAGVGIQTSTSNEANLGAGFGFEISGGRNGEVSSIETSITTLSTNLDSDIPGPRSDMYFGKSMNINIGITDNLILVPASLVSNSFDVISESIDPTPADVFDRMNLGISHGISIQPKGYETTFILSQAQIIEDKIPTLKNVRKLILQTNPKYTSNLPITDEKFGLNNDDPIFGADTSSNTPNVAEFRDMTGPSYTYLAQNETDSLTGDTVRYLNNQIKAWEESIRMNEEEKVNITNAAYREQKKNAELTVLENKYQAVIIGAALAGVTVGAGNIGAVPVVLSVPGAGYIGYGIFAVTSAASIVGSELAAGLAEYLQAKERIEAKYDANVVDTRTLGGGQPLTYTMTHETASTVSNSIEYSMNADLKTQFSLEVGGNGFEFEKSLELTVASTRDWTKATTETETVSYTLFDTDEVDEITIDVFPSLTGWGPIFKKREGGATSCPYEGEDVTLIYNPGTIISEATLQHDKPTITSDNIITGQWAKITNVPVDEAAVFNLTIGNESETGQDREYTVQLMSASNPYGAIARIDGFPFTNVIMPAGTQLNKVLTIQKGPGAVYNYDSLLFIVYPPCQFDGGVNYNSDLQDSIYISAHFIPSCTDVELISPELSWVANNSNDNILTTRISGYNINYFDLEELILEYKPASSSAWNPIKHFYLETTDPSLDLIPTNPNYAEYLWELPPIDGAYDLRARSSCILSEKISPIYSGVIDRINPHPFGTPSPADGILSPEDDISIQFNEPIDLGSLTVQNFDLRGVLNNTSIRPSASLLFDGVDDYLEVTGGANLSNRDFTLQMAVKRAEAGVDEALLSQGQSAASQVYLGFNAANQLVFRINDQEIASTQTFNDTEWHNIALSYDAENETADMYLADAVTTATEINTGDNSILSQYTGNNRLIIGKQDFGTPNAFHGNMQELRIWDKALNLSEFSSTNNTILSGSEAGLLYNWRMDEVEGDFAKDHVRNRDAVIHEAEWDVDPSGAAASFNGTSNKIKINQVNDVSITKEMNFTFELWFRGSGANPEVLFSNGSGSSTLSDALTSWVLQKDNEGKLHFLNDGNDFLISNENYFDGQWHHLAVVMNRDANISAIVDGNPKNSIPATPFQQFAGVSMHLGAQVYAGLTGPVETAYFSGEIDEFRFWNTNRKLEQVKRDRLNRMQGNEPGLLVYLPFESYVQDPAGPAILTPGFSEQIQPTLHTLEANGTTLVSETPTIKIQRPIEQVSFTYSVNNDKIIITPTSDPERLENVTIDITVKGVKDLRGNTMASPATWIAYINKNQVIWQDDNFNIEKAVGESVNFSSTILNQGGAAKSFTLQNMPTWLSASPSSGIVPANASLPVTFTIDPLVNIGDYAQDVQLLTDFNYPEKLTLNLKVRETAPDFTVNAAAFQNSMGIIGTLEIGNIPSTDTEDILVAYVGNQVRGSNNLAYNSSLDRYLVNLDVYSNTTSGETLQFKIWDASTGTLYSNVSPSNIVFSANQLIGTPQTPQLFATDFEIEEPLALNAGWNWLGYYLQNSDSTNFDLLFSNLNTQSGNQVNGQTSYAQQSSTSGWVGPLETEGIMPKNLYKFYSTTNDTLMLQGDILDPTTRTINLVTGWNWIGFISLRNQGIAQALGNLNPLPGDQIKGRSQFAYYVNEALGWQGSLQTLVPGAGYMYKSNQNTSFAFPYAGRFKGNVANPKDFYLSQYKVNYGEFASNMNVILAPNDVCENGYDANDLAVVALDENGIARGVAALQDVSASNYAFLTINGESGMNLSLYFVNRSTGEKYDEVKQLAFESNALRGNIDAPEMLDLTSRVCLSEDGTPAEQFSVYPTAFGQQINITYTAEAGDDEAFIGLYDITGREIISRTSVLGEGSNNMVLDFSAAQVTAGSYMLVFKTNSKQLTKKLIKVN